MDSPRKLTTSVLQAAELLGMYQAELARILLIKCNDIGELANARGVLQPDSETWQQARLFIRFFELLYKAKRGDAIAMCHWLRAENPELGAPPLLLMVDQLQIQNVIDHLADDQ